MIQRKTGIHKRGRVPYPIEKNEIVINIAPEFVMCIALTKKANGTVLYWVVCFLLFGNLILKKHVQRFVLIFPLALF